MFKEREYNSSLNQNEKDLNKCKKNSPCLWLEKQTKQNKNTISSVQLKYKFNMAPLKIYSFDCTD